MHLCSERWEKGWWLPESPNFAWLKDWTAQADLTLQVVDTASIAPGATFTEPLPNGFGFAAGPSSFGGKTINAIPQNFMVAAGANLGGQSQRIETMTFVFSLNELKSWRERERDRDRDKDPSEWICAPSDKMDLSGRLGLKEWLTEALTPVEGGINDPGLELLYAGYHPKPGAAPAVKPPTPAGWQNPAMPKAPGQQTLAEKPVECNVDKAKKDIKDARLQLAEVNLSSVKLLISNAQIAATEVKSTKSKLDKLYNDILKKKSEFNKYKEGRKQYTAVLDPDIALSEEQTLNYINYIEGAKVVMEDLVNRSLKAAALAEESGFDVPKYFDEANKAITAAEDAIKAGRGCAEAPHASELSQHAFNLDTALKTYAGNALTSAKEIVKYFDGFNKQATVVKTSVASFTTKTIDPQLRRECNSDLEFCEV